MAATSYEAAVGELSRPRDDARVGSLASFASRLFLPVDIASLVYFRIGFGVLFLIELWRYFNAGWIARYYIDPTFHFTYFGFHWVRPWPGDWMYVHFGVLVVCSVLVTVGLFYRVAAAILFLGFTYVFLLEQARYLNHFYLMSLMSFLMVIVPAHRALSIDALLRPSLASSTVPTWALWTLRAQIGIPYFYGGIAKINQDWLQGEPMRAWLMQRSDRPILGSIAHLEPTVWFFAYGGLLLDLLVVPFLLWGRTRPYALAAAIAFHLMNAWLFRIGIFPWFMIAATLMFFPPSWPRTVIAWITRRRTEMSALTRSSSASLSRGQWAMAGFLAVYFAVQFITPFRHLLYPGESMWTEEGHRFSWHMMLRSKSADLKFIATDGLLGVSWEVDPLRYVKRWQFDEMDQRPDMIQQLAYHMAEDLRAHGFRDPQVRVQVNAGLNGREKQPLIDPDVNLAAQPRVLWPPSSWIVPLEEPLRPRRT